MTETEAHEPAYGDDDPRVPGGRYYDGYWGDGYTVLERRKPPKGSYSGTDVFKIRCADGRVVEHQTAWEPWRDRVISEGKEARDDSGTPVPAA